MKKLIYIPLLALILIGQSCNDTNSSKKESNLSSAGESADKKSVVHISVQNLMQFIGKWEAEVTLTLEDKTYKVLYWVDCMKTSDGSGLRVDEVFTHPELGTMIGTNLVGYDAFDSKVKWFSVDNFGTTHEHVGEWLTPEHLYIEHNSLRESKKYNEKIDFVFKGKDELNFKIVATLDGVETEKGEGVFHKK